MMHWNDLGNMGFGGFGVGSILMLLFWVLVIIGAMSLVKHVMSSITRREDKEMAVDILKKRYAACEISKNECNEKMRVLNRKL